MASNRFAVEPFSLPVDQVTVSAVISLDRSNNRWNVTVVLTRVPSEIPIQGNEVDAELLDDKDVALKLLERPSGALVEAGGSLGTSSNALFRFENSNVIPTQLVITYRNRTVRFRVVSGNGD
jgi:hypothetical protein